MSKRQLEDVTITELGYRSRIASQLREAVLKFTGDPYQYPESFKREDLEEVLQLIHDAKTDILTLIELEKGNG